MATPRSRASRPRTVSGGNPRAESSPPSALTTPKPRDVSRVSGHASRVTMDAPRSFRELQARAKHLFGPEDQEGLLRLYHHGVLPIHDAHHYSQVHDNDVIVASFDDVKKTACEFANLVSTTKQTYAAPKLHSPRAEVVRPMRPSRRFVGSTSHKEQFVELPDCRRECWWDPKDREPMDTQRNARVSSEYKDSYLQRPTETTCRVSPPGPPLCIFKGNMPLRAQSHLQRDYTRPSAAPFVPLVTRNPAIRLGSGNTALADETTYMAQFSSKESAVPKQSPAKPGKAMLVQRPLVCSTEYNEQFVGRALDQPLIHLETTASH
eukprot:TRINITY_DN8470_c0_g1_i1.p1 TRINITY_DN8470_c0_g1~~TRINITY_DN8470_c0_g1_i1.p1  ORF type:complete len:321 (-),score=20.27 TRINITY_DN8470_c0_g1_i1:84-1046(-)